MVTRDMTEIIICMTPEGMQRLRESAYISVISRVTML